ncbi:unnamed protein product [Symbiodinium sp. CCMP2456]|nr:unnamed protein product [Symbiodinium sp. CCMP2456]
MMQMMERWGHPDCAQSEECTGNPHLRLICLLSGGDEGKIYCEACWRRLTEQNPDLVGFLRDGETSEDRQAAAGVDKNRGSVNPLQDQEVQQLRLENIKLKQENQSLRMQLQALPPAVLETAAWIRDELPRLLRACVYVSDGFLVDIPILALRQTHGHVNASLAFGDDHGNSQESIFKLVEQLFRGRVTPGEMEPLQVKLPKDAADDLGIRSRNNRRLLAFRALQSWTLDECIKVPCIARSHSAYLRDAKFKRWFDKGDDGLSGWSISSREGIAQHRGRPMFNTAVATEIGLRRLVEREKAHADADWQKIEPAERLLRDIKRRPASKDNDEETLTFGSRSEHAESSQPAAKAVATKLTKPRHGKQVKASEPEAQNPWSWAAQDPDPWSWAAQDPDPWSWAAQDTWDDYLYDSGRGLSDSFRAASGF